MTRRVETPSLRPGKGDNPMSDLDRLDINRTDFAVLKVLWKRGAVSAREAHEDLQASFSWAYSTTRTTLERMVKKGLVHKDTFHGLLIYRAAVSRVAVLAARVREFAESVLELEPGPVVSLFSQGEALDAAEIEELERLLATPPEDGSGEGTGR